MAEIKSAIELAMERTKGLVMDEKEKEASLVQEAENRLRGMVRRFLDGSMDVEAFRKQYEKLELAKRAKRDLLVDLIVTEFDAGDSGKLFDLLHVADGGLDKSLTKELDSLHRQFSQEVEKRSGDVKKRVLDRLKKMGIVGSALEPNVAAWDEWAEAVSETKHAFKGRLRQWKERVKAVKA
jgi:hypothetical protein